MKCEVAECTKDTFQGKKLCTTHHGRLYRLGSVHAKFRLFHGQSQNRSSTYRSWLMMKNRCGNPKCKDYKIYGGRGIRVCKSWEKFQNFRKDMGDKPTPLHTIGRLNSEKGYAKNNCRWETRAEQSRARKFCKLSIDKAQQMRALYEGGWTQKQIAKRFKVGKSTAAYAVTGKTWN